MRKFKDSETDEVLTEAELMQEYEENKLEIYESSGANSFAEYLESCLGKNGSLDEI